MSVIIVLERSGEDSSGTGNAAFGVDVRCDNVALRIHIDRGGQASRVGLDIVGIWRAQLCARVAIDVSTFIDKEHHHIVRGLSAG